MEWSHLSKHLLFHAALDAGANLQIRIWFSKETLPPRPSPSTNAFQKQGHIISAGYEMSLTRTQPLTPQCYKEG